MPSVLFICTANRFRSPLAAAMFQKAIMDFRPLEQWSVDSAGTWAYPGLPALRTVVMLAKRYGIDLGNHLSKPVTGKMVPKYDLILVMEAGQSEALQYEFPLQADRIYLLSQIVDGRLYDIPDLSDSEDGIVEVCENIHDLIQTGHDNICSLALRLHNNRDKSGSRP
jgi:protein-tyrosine phosphatase